MRTLGMLYGMRPAPPQKCTVLELGCGDGTNLVPMAYHFPESSFTGIDLAEGPIAHGQLEIENLGVKNITLKSQDLMDHQHVGGETYDYIIVHGLYSWVPSQVKEKILEICGKCLSEQGIAFVSYNCLPGGYVNEMVSKMLLYHVRDKSPQDRLASALAFARRLPALPHKANLHHWVLKRAIAELLQRAPAQTFHDEMAPLHSAIYFHEFASAAGEHGLQYICESYEFEDQSHLRTTPLSFPDKNGELSRVEREQYHDFAMGRAFRGTLLCRNTVPLSGVRPEAISEFRISSPARANAEQVNFTSDEMLHYEGPEQSSAEVSHRHLKAILHLLKSCYPQSIGIDELLTVAEKLLVENGVTGDASIEKNKLLEELLDLHYAGLVEFESEAGGWVGEAGEFPKISPLAQWQLTRGNAVTAMNHRHLKVESPTDRKLLSLLDGQRNRDELIAAMEWEAEEEGEKREARLERKLKKFAKLRLLVS
jgi:methyltransferase-like protein